MLFPRGNVIEIAVPSLRVGVVRYMCAHLLNTTQWFVMVGRACYLQISQLEVVLEQYDSMEMLHWSYPTAPGDEVTTREWGVCSKGTAIEVLSQRLLSAVCSSHQWSGNSLLEEGHVSSVDETQQHHCNLSNTVEVRPNLVPT